MLDASEEAELRKALEGVPEARILAVIAALNSAIGTSDTMDAPDEVADFINLQSKALNALWSAKVAASELKAQQFAELCDRLNQDNGVLRERIKNAQEALVA